MPKFIIDFCFRGRSDIWHEGPFDRVVLPERVNTILAHTEKTTKIFNLHNPDLLWAEVAELDEV